MESGLVDVSIPSSVTGIGKGAFLESLSLTQLTSVSLSSKLRYIDELAFSKSDLKSISIPNLVTSIGIKAFLLCSSMTSVVFVDDGSGGHGLRHINVEAFKQSGVRSLTIPAAVTTIGSRAFQDCDSLTSLSFTSTTGNLKVIGADSFKNAKISTLGINVKIFIY